MRSFVCAIAAMLVALPAWGQSADSGETPPGEEMTVPPPRQAERGEGAPDAIGIRVTGTCEVSVQPDRVRVSVSFTATEDAAWQTVDITNARMAEARANIEALDLADLVIEAARTAIAPATANTDTGERVTGYTGRITLVVTTTEMERLGALVEAALAGGTAQLVEAGRFVSIGLRRAAEGECLAEAAGNARARAERLANALGVAVGPVVSVDDGAMVAATPRRPLGDQVARLGGEVPASLDRHTIRGSVEVGFALAGLSGGGQ